MAADYRLMIRNLLEFFDFSGRSVVSVGAGGGQLVEYGRSTGRVTAVDQDPAALDALRERLAQAGLADKFTLVRSDFMGFREAADVVLFEFCLHEMPDPTAALAHAMTLAPSVVVMDHWPGSAWAFFVAEEDKARAAWAAVVALRPERTVSFEAAQFFKDYQELWQKVHVQGAVALDRIEEFRGQTDLSIPMSYGFALLAGGKRS